MQMFPDARCHAGNAISVSLGGGGVKASRSVGELMRLEGLQGGDCTSRGGVGGSEG